jgi:hypothetical protein
MSAPRLPTFVSARSASGRIVVGWEAAGRGNADLIVALRPIGPDLAAAFWSGALDNDLIRYPAQLQTGGLTVHIPAGREVWLTLLGGDGVNALNLTVSDACEDPERVLEAPTCHQTIADRHVELVFANDARVDLDALASRVARGVGKAPGEADVASRDVGVAALQGVFLTRIAFPPLGPGGGRVLIFEGPVNLSNVPKDAQAHAERTHHLPPGCDGLVDGLTPTGRCVTYVLLDGAEGWTPRSSQRVRPPYHHGSRPHLLGAVVTRLSHLVEEVANRGLVEGVELCTLALQAELLEGATRCLDPGESARVRALEVAATLRDAPRFGP